MNVTLDRHVLVRLATQDDPVQAALTLRVLTNATLIAVPTPALCEWVWVLLQVRQVVCNTPDVEAGLALLERGGDFADGVIAFEGELLGGTEFISFDQPAVKLL